MIIHSFFPELTGMPLKLSEMMKMSKIVKIKMMKMHHFSSLPFSLPFSQNGQNAQFLRPL